MKTLIKTMGASALLTLSLGANAQIIDLFTDFQTVADVQDGAVQSTGATSIDQPAGGSANIVGGYRDISVNALSGAADNPGPNVNGECEAGDLCSRMTINGGELNFSNDAPVVGTGVVQWDGQDGSMDLDREGLGGVDFVNQAGCPAGGCDRFVFEVLSSDLAFDFSIGLYTDDDEFTVFDLAATSGPGTRNIFFSFFENANIYTDCGGAVALPAGVNSVTCGAGGTVDMTNVGAMELLLNTGGSGQLTGELDLRIEGVTKTGVPEPSVIALMGLGLVGLGFAARKRRA